MSVSLSADGSRVAIGAPYNGTGSDAGHVRVYDWNGSSWTQLGADIDGETAHDLSGWSVSLSADGSRVAIGALSNEGTVRVYDWNGSSWTQLGADIDGEAANDESGWSVSLSADGSRVAIGAPGNDGTGSRAGHVRVYDWNGSNWTQLGAESTGRPPMTIRPIGSRCPPMAAGSLSGLLATMAPAAVQATFESTATHSLSSSLASAWTRPYGTTGSSIVGSR